MIGARRLSGGQPSTAMTAEAGLLPDLTGGEDALAELRKAVEAGQVDSA